MSRLISVHAVATVPDSCLPSLPLFLHPRLIRRHDLDLTILFLFCTPPALVSLRSSSDSTSLCSYRRLPIYDNLGAVLTSFLDGCVEFIRAGQHYGSVLVHCNQVQQRANANGTHYFSNRM